MQYDDLSTKNHHRQVSTYGNVAKYHQALFRELLCVALGVRLRMVGEKYGCLRKAVVINLDRSANCMRCMR